MIQLDSTEEKLEDLGEWSVRIRKPWWMVGQNWWITIATQEGTIADYPTKSHCLVPGYRIRCPLHWRIAAGRTCVRPRNQPRVSSFSGWWFVTCFILPYIENIYILLGIAYIYSGWWFGTWIWFFHILGIIIPSDSYFSEGFKPPTRFTSRININPFESWCLRQWSKQTLKWFSVRP